jgi:D-xylose reductase
VQERLVRFCQESGIQVTAYSSFGAMSYVELQMAGMEETLFENATVADIAKKVSKSPAQVLLRWAVQRGLQIIPKSVKVERLQENAAVADWKLEDGDMKAISALDKGKRFNDPGNYAEPAFGLFYPIFE